MSATASVDPEAVINQLASQVGHLHAQLAMRSVALDQAHQRIAELEAAAEQPERRKGAQK